MWAMVHACAWLACRVTGSGLAGTTNALGIERAAAGPLTISLPASIPRDPISSMMEASSLASASASAFLLVNVDLNSVSYSDKLLWQNVPAKR